MIYRGMIDTKIWMFAAAAFFCGPAHSQSQTFAIHGRSKTCNSITELDRARSMNFMQYFTGWTIQDYDAAIAWAQACGQYGWPTYSPTRISYLASQQNQLRQSAQKTTDRAAAVSAEQDAANQAVLAAKELAERLVAENQIAAENEKQSAAVPRVENKALKPRPAKPVVTNFDAAVETLPSVPKPAPPAIDPALLDAKGLEEKYGTEAMISCGSDADDYLRSIAKYEFKWDDIGFMEFKFDRYLEHVDKPGVLIALSLKAKLQNGFGAYQRVRLLCYFDTQNKKVLDYRVVDN
jgi:hypothetical protein